MTTQIIALISLLVSGSVVIEQTDILKLTHTAEEAVNEINDKIISQAVDIYVLKTNDYSIVSLTVKEQYELLKSKELLK